jgi:hypothetical protein
MEHKAEPPVTRETAYNGSDEVVTQKKSGGKIKRHCRRFWWLGQYSYIRTVPHDQTNITPDLIILAIIILVVVLPLIFVAIPKKAQHDLNASTLEVKSQEVTQSSADGIHLKLITEAKSGSSFHPTIEAFRAGLSLDGKNPFLYIDVPTTKAEAETEIIVEQDLKFASLDQFVNYNKVVMGSEEFKVYMNGKTKLKLKGLPTMSVNYDKTITMKGMCGLP